MMLGLVLIKFYHASKFHFHFGQQAADNNPPTKINSIVCADCDGNGNQ